MTSNIFLKSETATLCSHMFSHWILAENPVRKLGQTLIWSLFFIQKVV